MSDPVVRGRPEAAAVCLEQPAPRSRRQEGVVRGLVPLALAGLFFATGHPLAAGAAATLGALTLALALASPERGYAALSAAVGWLGEQVGHLLAWVLLAPVFYLVVTPLGLLTRRGQGDRLGRRFERGAASYWSARPALDRATRRQQLERPY
jgi:hypothetical protein